jgi:RNA polymerase sigma-70 factor (ECF subfamily)
VTDAARATLRNLLVNNYMSLSQRLARHLGAATIQDQGSSLESETEAGAARRPTDDLLRIAVNIAAERRRAGSRKLNKQEIDDLLEMTEEPAKADFELQDLELALDELPQFTRAVFKAALLDKVSHRDIAKRFGTSERTIDAEVQKALEHGLRRLGQKNSALKGF